MKNLRFLFVLPAVLIFTSCVVKVNSKSKTTLPPGQAKKVAGTQSAKPFAPVNRRRTKICRIKKDCADNYEANIRMSAQNLLRRTLAHFVLYSAN
jgi:hypothetical protein